MNEILGETPPEQPKSYEALMAELRGMIEQAKVSDTASVSFYSKLIRQQILATQAAEREKKLLACPR